MSVIVEDQSFGVTCVTLKCDMYCKTGLFEKVNLKLNGIPSHTSYLEIGWLNHGYRWDGHSLVEHPISFCLKELHERKMKSSQLPFKQVPKRDAVPFYYRQPHAVWVTVDVGHFKETSTVFLSKKCNGLDDHVAAIWKSIKVSFTPASKHFSFKFFLHFNNFGISEVKAGNILTDYFFLQQTNCDVHFRFPLGKKIGGHISIIAATSPVFAAMFRHNMKESKTGEVVIKDIERDIFYELLHYIYSGRTSMAMTEAIAQSLIAASEKYNIPDLKNKCADFLLARVTDSTAQIIFEVADRYHIQELKEECIQILMSRIEIENVIPLIIWANEKRAQKVKEAALKFIKKNFQAVCQSKDYENMMFQFPDLCLEATRCTYR
uniref:Btb/poz domain-containing protein n=1 Tax=Daphnia magna TaxID=35525 RepID=A0A0P6D3V4_9CRUS